MYPDVVPYDPELPPLMLLADVKALLGVPALTTTYDAQLEFAIEVVSDLIRTYTGRALTRRSYTDEFHSTRPPRFESEGGRAFLSLMEFPVISVTEILKDGIAQSLVTLKLHRNIGILWPTGFGPCSNVIVTYEAGYLPIPATLRSVFIDLVRRQLAALGVDLTTVSPTVPDAVQARSIAVGALRVDYGVSVTSGAVSGATLSPLSALVLDEYSEALDMFRHPRMWAATPA